VERTLRIGTRRSPLAVWQAEHVRGLLERAFPGLTCTLVRIVTQGDRILDVPLAQVGGKGLFVNEIESSLLRGACDLAVHSMKDLPAELHAGLVLAAVPPREDPRDALLCRDPSHRLDSLPPGACIGTSSLRRAALLRAARGDVVTASCRGNVETRIRRLDEGRFDAIVLALAGLKRLGLDHRVTEILSPERCLPAIGQGALAVECRQADTKLRDMLGVLHDPVTAASVQGERSFLSTVEGSCQIPVACHGTLAHGRLRLSGLVASLDGSACVRRTREGPPDHARELGRRLAEEILDAGGRAILEAIRAGAACTDRRAQEAP